MISTFHQPLTRTILLSKLGQREDLHDSLFRNNYYKFRNTTLPVTGRGWCMRGVSLGRAEELALLVHFQYHMTSISSWSILPRLRYSGQVRESDTG